MRIANLLFVCCLVFPMSASVAQIGFSADDLTAAAKAKSNDPSVVLGRQLVAATDTLRAAFVLNPETAWTILSADERVILQNALAACLT